MQDSTKLARPKTQITNYSYLINKPRQMTGWSCHDNDVGQAAEFQAEARNV